MNPFIIKGYDGPEFFCDREMETQRVLNAIENQRNLTLVSLRKMGKTGLIYHVFNHLDPKKYDMIYLDIYDTSNLTGFINKFASALLSLKKTFGEKVMDFLESFRYIRPLISVDPLSGLPTASFKISSEEEAHQTIGDLFRILDEKSKIKPVVLAFDEFQQIIKYPEKNVEAMIRSHIQHMPRLSIIFSGSNKSLLGQIFTNPSRPLYQSTELMFLNEIDKGTYREFIQQLFSGYGIGIGNVEADGILDWARTHTFYVQYCCNKLFEKGGSIITNKEVNEIFQQILMEQEPFYLEFRNLLTTHQWQLLRAIARENGAKNITSSSFLKRHELSNASTVRRGIDALLDKELIYLSQDRYYLQDVFFSRWFEWQA